MMKKSLAAVFNNTILAVIILFAISSFFRIFFLDLIEFKFDEAFTVYQLFQFYAQPYLMQTGPPQSTGVYNPPFFNYLMILLSLPSRDPLYLSFIIAVINTIFIIIFYLVIKKFYGNLTAILTALFLSLSPWSILFSRKIWIPDLLLPFITLFLYFFHTLILEKKNSAILPLFFILALLSQMHASGIFFTLATILILILTKIEIKWQQAVVGFVIGLVFATPYFIRQLTSTPFCIDCVAFFSYQNSARFFDWQNFIQPWQFISGLNFQIVLGEDYSAFLNTLPVPGLIHFIFLMSVMLPVLGIIIILKFNKNFWPLIFYPLFIPLLYFLTRTPSYTHYFMVILPFTVLLSALGISFLWNYYHHPFLKAMVLLLPVVVLLANVIFELSFYKYLADKKNIQGDFGAIFPLTKQVVEEATQQYFLLPFYQEVKTYAQMFAQTPFLHQRLGEYFWQKNQPLLAEEEFKKALLTNERDIYSRANLSQIYVLTGQREEAKEQINILAQLDSTTSAKLQKLLEEDAR